MSHKATLLGAAASIVLLASGAGAANAAHMKGWYVNLEGGAVWTEDFDVALTGATTTTVNLETNTGWAGIASVGYGFGDHWRVELEGGYRHNELDKANYTGGGTSSPAGDLSQWSLMANIAYDLMLTDALGLSFGVGAGAANARLEFTSSGAPPAVTVDDDDWRFAYQGIVGLNYELGPRTQLTLNYRYLRVDSPEWDGGLGAGAVHFEADDLVSHTVTVGVRFDLWPDEEPLEIVGPVPSPPDLPPEPPAQSFMIFFGFDKCNITPEADNVLNQAAQAARQMGSVTVQIVGHTDTRGTHAYNRKLSLCRAHATKTNLVDKGVPANAIATSGKGETELLVQTADGVKEPQNRRATVDLQ
jgi:outer membrane protein OmpA-like peptidoglycan-associated protein